MKKHLYIFALIAMCTPSLAQKQADVYVSTGLRAAEPGNKAYGIEYQVSKAGTEGTEYCMSIFLYDVNDYYVIDDDKNYLVLYQANGDSTILKSSGSDYGFDTPDRRVYNDNPIITHFMSAYTYAISDINDLLSHEYIGYSIAGWKYVDLTRDGKSKFYKTFNKGLKDAKRNLDRRYELAVYGKNWSDPQAPHNTSINILNNLSAL